MTRYWGSCIVLAAVFSMSLTTGVGRADTWFPAASLSPTRAGPTATLLPDGEVLLAGGYDGAYGSLGVAQLFDPASDTWAAAAPMLVGRSYQVAVLLGDGEVLVVGGDEAAEPSEGPKTAELYDPAGNTWTAISSPPELQEVQNMTVLQSGEVLLLGRFGPESYGASRGAAIYDPTSSSWRNAAAPEQTTTKQTFDGGAAVLLPDGNVLTVGGDIWEDTYPPVEVHYTVLNSTEEYDPSTNTWSSAAPMHQVRAQETATVLNDGDVLVTGGVDQIQTGGFGDNAVGSVELYDPQTNTWSMLASMNVERAGHSATLLPDGDVLVAGGSDCGGGDGCLGYGGSGNCCGASSAEVYAPATNTWTFTTPATTGIDHTATLLPGGGVLVTGGGFAAIPMPGLNTAEIYASSYPPDEQSAQTPAATTTPILTLATPSTCNVLLASTHITTTKSGRATVKLTGIGASRCRGRLTLTVKTRDKAKKRRSKTTIATANFSIPPGQTTKVELELRPTGRALLSAGRGRLRGTLTLRKSSPAPSQIHAEKVNLVRQK